MDLIAVSKNYIDKIIFVYQKALIPTFNTSCFHYKVTFVNSHHTPTYSKGYFTAKLVLVYK